ncbi:hypothetical protein PN497_09230 [Sphaerospermopsis kisseleviana CS-549]|uniref:Apea-like HEPN domain-containing protein n=1 Tax=Sphaerospermopsis kisseleviana CS-549 TaxID=3021783 RepID=A0ABT4ZQ58_9CYAN|nr:hypothetical protein [Sphaerospermopsis kisseleviana]MDB9441539.1 hypothetical protein [Sphaerospermopsis kisseleviana CS-549]BAZ83688.1 hypothetical protein NIES73_49770 [Sphaerospermopsis kisseleviana NIES-73]
MEINATLQDFAGWIKEVLRYDLEETDDRFLFALNNHGISHEIELSKDNLSNCIQNLQAMNSVEETILANGKYYEVLLREESLFPRVRIRVRDDSLMLEDSDNSITYCLSSPSNEYLLFLLYTVASITNPRALANPIPRAEIMRRANDIEDIFEFLKRTVFSRFITLRLESARNRPPAEFEKFSSAFLFQLSYNLDAALVPQKHLDEILRTGKISQVRRPSLSDIDPPRRHYIPDLIYHYQLAVAADNPFLEYLSYYHVIEHFFEEVFNEDLIEKIKNKITHPDFSYKRKKDISKLIKDISRSLQIRNEEITFSEQEGLRLTIERYVNIDDLRDKLNSYDSTLINYYKTSKVTFAMADEINIDDSNTTNIFKKLAARIYKTRNSIVHSKESDKARYMPFKDDRVLVKEIPLLRFVAEQIIINTSILIE